MPRIVFWGKARLLQQVFRLQLQGDIRKKDFEASKQGGVPSKRAPAVLSRSCGTFPRKNIPKRLPAEWFDKQITACYIMQRVRLFFL